MITSRRILTFSILHSFPFLFVFVRVVCFQWGAEINCLVRCHLRYDDGGCLLESVHTWLPMPDTTAPPIKRNEPN